jgi:hypothetical protein
MPARRQIEYLLALTVNFSLAALIRIPHQTVRVSDIKPIAQEQHTVGHIQTGQENFTVIGVAVLVGITKQSDPIGRFLATSLYHKDILVRQHVGQTRIVEILSEQAYLETRRRPRHSRLGPAYDFRIIARRRRRERSRQLNFFRRANTRHILTIYNIGLGRMRTQRNKQSDYYRATMKPMTKRHRTPPLTKNEQDTSSAPLVGSYYLSKRVNASFDDADVLIFRVMEAADEIGALDDNSIDCAREPHFLCSR